MGLEALQSFFAQFGKPDVYTQILFEILFEELTYQSEDNYNDEKIIHLPGEKGQDRDKDDYNS